MENRMIENKSTISFFELLKLKIANQNDNTSKFFTFFSVFLCIFNILILNLNYVQIGMYSRTLANQTGNFWITILLMIPYIFLSIISFVFCFLSKYFKKDFIGKLNFYICLFNILTVLFFIIYISAVF